MQDDDLKYILHWMEHSTTPAQSELQILSPTVKYLWSNSSLLRVVDGVLYIRWVDDQFSKLLFVAPKKLKQEIMSLCHETKLAGHPGICKTLQKIRQSAYRYGMSADVSLFVKSCKDCNIYKKPCKKAKASMSLYHAGAPVERIHLDILGPFNPSVTSVSFSIHSHACLPIYEMDRSLSPPKPKS